MCFGEKNGRILYVGEGVTSPGFASATPPKSGNPPGYGLSVSHSTERGHRAGKECEQISEQTMNKKDEKMC